MDEQSKSYQRRIKDSNFTERWLKGSGIDVGCGDDPINGRPEISYPNVTSVRPWDRTRGDGDATFLTGVADESYDFLHSSHCLEHLRDPEAALKNWTRVVKKGGHVVVTIPDENLYEQGVFPSRWNSDHKHCFTVRSSPSIPRSINVINMLWTIKRVSVERVQLIRDGWDPKKIGTDQTMSGAECAIEFVLMKTGD